jgi:NitT/TauT family transport system permease protein
MTPLPAKDTAAAKEGASEAPGRILPAGRLIGRDGLIIVAAFVGLVVVWEWAVRAFDIPSFVLPAPSAVAERFAADLSGGAIGVHLRTTLIEVVAGFALAAVVGLAIGTAVALVPVVDRIVYPYILALQTIPKVAIAPLLIIWAGFGIQSKIVTAALIAFFPVLVNVIAGLKTVDTNRLLLMRALKANAWQTLIKVRFPGMLPYYFAGLEIGIVFSTIGAIVGEFIGASQGLGTLIIQRQAAIDVAGVFSVLIFLSVMGIVLNLLLRLIARRYVFWAQPSA